MKKIALFLALGLFIVTTLSGQDIHLSQYDASPIIQNPANTGVDKNMKYRIVNQYRNQWDAVAYKSFISTALAYDMPLKEKWGVGGYVLNDNSSRVFNSFNFTLSGSHDIAMGNQDKHHLLIGLQAGIIHKKMRTGNYSFDSQYSDGSFDTDLPSNEVFEKEVRLMPEVNMGFAYMNTDKSLRYNPYGGLSLSHIIKSLSRRAFCWILQ
jgi:type IX secretion system PorP/SprF family membrane protein